MTPIRAVVTIATTLALLATVASPQVVARVPPVGARVPAGVAAFGVEALRRGLREPGHVAGPLEVREDRGGVARAPGLPAELVRLAV